MADTFGTIWRQVKLDCSLATPLQAQRWVRQATRMFQDESNWSFLRAEDEFLITAAKTGTVDLTQGSAAVPSAGGADGITFVASDVGRQLRFGVGPPLTIIAVDVTGDTAATLERPWRGDTTADAAVVVADLYATCPADFGHFISVLDPQNQRQVGVFRDMLELNRSDPGRYNTGDPWALVNYRRSALTATLDRVQYEWWPYWEATATRRFPYYYFRRPADLGDDDYFPGPLRDRGDVILEGALALAAEWPGTEDRRSVYFNLNLAAVKRGRYEQQMAMLEVRDQETYLTWLLEQPWYGWGGIDTPLVPGDANYAQAHE